MEHEEAVLRRVTRELHVGYLLVVVSFVVMLANVMAFVMTNNWLCVLMVAIVSVCIWVQVRAIHQLQDAAADLRFVLDKDLPGGGERMDMEYMLKRATWGKRVGYLFAAVSTLAMLANLWALATRWYWPCVVAAAVMAICVWVNLRNVAKQKRAEADLRFKLKQQVPERG